MKKFLSCFLILIFFSGCDEGVTRTGNPQPAPTINQPSGLPGQPACQGDCNSDTAQQSYVNTTFGVRITLPNNWTAQQQSITNDTLTVEFSGNGIKPTMVVAKLLAEPTSLGAYLRDKFPTRSFTAVQTLMLQGLLYDDPTSGSNGGDLRVYYFLRGVTFVEITVEIFPNTETLFLQFLDGLSLATS